MKRNVMTPKERAESILAAALAVAEREHYAEITSYDIARAAKCTSGLVFHYFGTLTNVRRRIMYRAVAEKNLKVIAQGLGRGDGIARQAERSVKLEAVKLLAQ